MCIYSITFILEKTDIFLKPIQLTLSITLKINKPKTFSITTFINSSNTFNQPNKKTRCILHP